MRDWKKVFEGKKITVMGLGLLGRSVGDTKFLLEQGAEVVVTDLKTKEELQHSVDALSSFSNVTFRLGGHELEDFRGRDFILKSAGIPLNSPYIEEAQKAGIPIKMSASWFAELSGVPVVGITGTRGKSTTTHMLHEIMLRARLKVLLGGNVRGVSTLALLEKVEQDSIALFELDSWQLQGWGEEKMSPHLSIFTTFMRDHMNYYHGDMDQYLADKAQIFLYQEPSDTLILGTQVKDIVRKKYKKQIRSQVIIADEKKFPKDLTLRVPGSHNAKNAMCAIEAARVLGIDEGTIKSALADFKGVPGRLEFIGEVGGVSIYNDATSTTPDALLAALRALNTKKNVILIMGGSDKDISLDSFPKDAIKKTKKIILLSGSGTDRIRSFVKKAPLYDHLSGAVQDAFDAAEEGDIILFSPGFASFGLFKNEFDRNDQFVSLVQSRL